MQGGSAIAIIERMSAIVIIGLWIVLAIIVAAAADARGRSPGGWLLMSLVFSPLIAVLFLLAFPAREKPDGPIIIERRRD